MCIGNSESGMRTAAPHDQNKEAILIRSYDEERRKLPVERDHARHDTGSKKARDQGCYGFDNMEKWMGMFFDKLLMETRERGRWSRLINEATNPRSEDG